MSRFQANKIFIFVVSAILIIISFSGCTKKTPEESTKKQEAPETVEVAGFAQAPEDTEQKAKLGGLSEEQKILSFDMAGYTEDGRKKWDIKGKSADIVSDTIILTDIEANAYNDDRTVGLKARSGTYNKRENSVRLENNVIVTTSDGMNLACEWLEWESETDIIKTNSFVEVEKDNLYAAGYGASANTKYKEVQLNKDIVVRQDEITISCSGPLAIDYDKNKASFYDKVKVTEPRGELVADYLDIFFNPDSQEIEKVVAERNVVIKQDPNVAKGQKIIYTLASGEVILTGNPEIRIYSKKDLEDAFTGD